MMINNMVFARILTQEEFGAYFLFSSTIIFLSIVVKVGQKQAIVRLVSEALIYEKTYKIVSVVVSAVLVISLTSFVLFILFLLGLDEVIANLFNAEEFVVLSVWLLVWIWLLALETPVSETFRGLHRIGEATLFDNLLSHVLLTLVLIVIYFQDIDLTLKGAVFITIGCIIVPLLIGGSILTSRFKDYEYRSVSVTKELLYISLPLMFVNISNFVLNNSGIWLSSIMLDQKSIAVYGAAWKFVNIIVFPLTIFNLVIQPTIVRLYEDKSIEKLEKILRGLSSILSIPAILVSILLLVYNKDLITIVYGDSYIDSSSVLVILTIGQIINVITGQNIILLGLCGKQVLLMKITIFSVIFSIVISSVLVNYFMVNGIAMGVSGGLILCNLMALYSVYKSIGIKTYASYHPDFIKEAYRKIYVT
ncbi:hypothetical protein A3194_10440 [Candidatus Thiodiazotropha endoloripes]|nr:hypothetical protein A3194_10440 [Candidatus Thiodiazotropha endoloripes]